MPTALERNGDFSQTVATNGNRIWIKDPRSVRAGAGVHVQHRRAGVLRRTTSSRSDRINPIGQSDAEHVPDAERDRSGAARGSSTTSSRASSRSCGWIRCCAWTGTSRRTRRSTAACSSAMRCARAATSRRDVRANLFLQGTSADAELVRHRHLQHRRTRCCTRSIQSTVLEVTAGLNYSAQSRLRAERRRSSTRSAATCCPALPSVLPAGQPAQRDSEHERSAARTRCRATRNLGGFEGRYPFDAKNPTWDFTANLTKLKGAHNMKAGIFVERVLRPARAILDLQRRPTISTANASNPFDTNFGFANALARLDQHATRSRPPSRLPKGGSTRSSSSCRTTGGCRQKFTLDYGVAVRPHRPDVRRRPAGRLLRSAQVGPGEGAEALRAGLPEQRRDLLGRACGRRATRSPVRS